MTHMCWAQVLTPAEPPSQHEVAPLACLHHPTRSGYSHSGDASLRGLVSEGLGLGTEGAVGVVVLTLSEAIVVIASFGIAK